MVMVASLPQQVLACAPAHWALNVGANLPIIPRTLSRKGQTGREKHQENVKKT
jgi:hypothetical protein